ncbi:MAG: hypothetical protein KBH06_06380 [Spirochaetes bacterium]|nr:hypothetical protein [Spirochaetota bacterium]
MLVNTDFSFKCYFKKLWLRIAIFTFAGMGWDILMTTSQQIIAGTLTLDALNTASTWMYIPYSLMPFYFYPADFIMNKLKMKYWMRVVPMLAVFYIAELTFGSLMLYLGIEPWNYNWYIQPEWNYKGIISFYPVIVILWGIFVVLSDFLDGYLRSDK